MEAVSINEDESSKSANNLSENDDEDSLSDSNIKNETVDVDNTKSVSSELLNKRDANEMSEIMENEIENIVEKKVKKSGETRSN